MTFLRIASGLRRILGAAVMCAAFVSAGSADVFDTGTTQFTIDFVPISREPNPSAGYGVVNYNYRMGVSEVTNAQMAAVEAALGLALGSSHWPGDDIPVNNRHWFHAAHFVNWLNTSQGHQPAYKFEGAAFRLWSPEEAWGGTNLYRHKDAHYFLPTEDEWVKAAYWNGTNLQTYATLGDVMPGADVDSRYGQSEPYGGPWTVGSGTVEFNGTYNMMGNVDEWVESPYYSGQYSGSMGYSYPPNSNIRGLRGGGYQDSSLRLRSTSRYGRWPNTQLGFIGFRVASVPEPGSTTMLLAGAMGLLFLWQRRHAA